MRLADRAKGAAMRDAATIIGECAGIVRAIVAPERAAHGSAKAAWHAAARALGIGPRRVRAHLNGEVRSVPAWEADRLRAAALAARDLRIRRLETELATLRAERNARAEMGAASNRNGGGVDRRAVRGDRAADSQNNGSDLRQSRIRD